MKTDASQQINNVHKINPCRLVEVADLEEEVSVMSYETPRITNVASSHCKKSNNACARQKDHSVSNIVTEMIDEITKEF